MEQQYTLIGHPMSPYSLKVKAYLEYKQIPFCFMSRNLKTEKFFREKSKLPLLPVLVRPDGTSLQDSTYILQELEQIFPARSVMPPSPLYLLALLLEEFGDEWCNKLMFFQRWNESDALDSAKGLSSVVFNVTWWGRLFQPVAARLLKYRMQKNLSKFGASKVNEPLLETSWLSLLKLLDKHFEVHAYIFGGKPSYADFSLYGQLAQCYRDATARKSLDSNAPNIIRWIGCMKNGFDGVADKEWSNADDLLITLKPLLVDVVNAHFLVWSKKNGECLSSGEKNLTMQIDGFHYEQMVQKYPAISRMNLVDRYKEIGVDKELSLELKEIMASLLVD